MKEILKPILEMLAQGATISIATILSHAGSTPRTAGAKMMVRSDHTIAGTIGGGLVEGLIIKEAVTLIDQGKNVIREFHLDSDLKESLDMVCGGSLTVLIEIVGPDQLDFYKTLAAEVNQGRACSRLLEITPDNKGGQDIRQGLLLSDNKIVGDVKLPESPGFDIQGSLVNQQVPAMVMFGNRRLVAEPVLAGNTLYIFGGGHVSLCLAEIASVLGLTMVIIDDREEFANPQRFPMADRVHAISSFTEFFDSNAMDVDSFVVIVTRGHLHDQEVLENALKTKAGYIGMIGSRRKREQIYTNLLDQGVLQSDLDRVYSPIGLKIHAQTPAEIAVSIAAELVDVKNGKTST